MEAGHELDILIAEKVFGAIRDETRASFVENRPMYKFPQHDGYVLPPYSQSIQWAWDVIEQMRKKGWYWHVAQFTDGIKAGFVYSGVKSVEVHAKSAPVAICLAALQALSTIINDGGNDVTLTSCVCSTSILTTHHPLEFGC